MKYSLIYGRLISRLNKSVIRRPSAAGRVLCNFYVTNVFSFSLAYLFIFILLKSSQFETVSYITHEETKTLHWSYHDLVSVVLRCQSLPLWLRSCSYWTALELSQNSSGCGQNARGPPPLWNGSWESAIILLLLWLQMLYLFWFSWIQKPRERKKCKRLSDLSLQYFS